LIEEILNSILHHEILMREDQNTEAVLQDLSKSAFNTSESCISSKQSKLNNDVSNSQSIQGMYDDFSLL